MEDDWEVEKYRLDFGGIVFVDSMLLISVELILIQTGISLNLMNNGN